MKRKCIFVTRRLFTVLGMILMVSATYAGDVVVKGVEFKIKKNEGIAIAEKAEPSEVSMEYELPATVSNKGITFRVTTVAKGCFKDCSSLTKLILPENVVTIEKKAFRGCTSLSEISIPSTATNIDPDAFEDCESLKNFIWYRNVDGVIYKMADFAGQEKTASLFKVSNETVKDFSVPETINGYRLIGIEKGAFQSLVSLERATLPNTIKELPSHLFANLKMLKQITLPADITELKEGFFDGCQSLVEVNIPSGVKMLGRSAFRGCDSLKNIQIPAGITAIPDSCFAQSGLLNFVMPLNISQIGKGAFAGCQYLKKLEISASVTSIPTGFAEGCPRLQFVKLPETLVSIGPNAFKNCRLLHSVNIPESLETIGEECFMGTIIPEKTKDVKVDGVVYQLKFQKNGERTAVALYVADSLSSSLVLPRVIKGYELVEIDDDCFSKNADIESVEIPSGVKIIGRQAFLGCENLVSVTFPSSLTHISTNAFANCSKLSAVSLPHSVEEIGLMAFSGCTSLKEVVFPTALNNIEESAFTDCSMLEVVDLSECENLTVIIDNAFYGCKKLHTLKLPSNLTELEFCAFYDCPSLTEVVFPASLTKIGRYAFGGESPGLKKAYFRGAKLSDFGYAGIPVGAETYRLYDNGSTSHYSLPATARINDVKLEHNVMVNGVKGMNIVVDFDIQREKGASCRASAYFYFSDGTALNDYNDRYSTVDGKVASGTDFKPGYDSANYAKLKIFMPLSELHLNSSTKRHNLKTHVSIWSSDNEELCTSKYENFTVTFN